MSVFQLSEMRPRLAHYNVTVTYDTISYAKACAVLFMRTIFIYHPSYGVSFVSRTIGRQVMTETCLKDHLRSIRDI